MEGSCGGGSPGRGHGDSKEGGKMGGWGIGELDRGKSGKESSIRTGAGSSIVP